MATCPRCQRRDRCTLAPTGESKTVALPIGSHALAGAQMKVAAVEVAEMRLRCAACGWTIVGHIDGDALVENPPGQTSETRDIYRARYGNDPPPAG